MSEYNKEDIKNLHYNNVNEIQYEYGGQIYHCSMEHLKEILVTCWNLQQENQELKKQLEYLRSGEYYNQLRFERDMLQYVADNGKISKEDKEFIDMTHRNTELLEVIEELREYILNHELVEEKDHYVLNGNELLQILDKAKEN